MKKIVKLKLSWMLPNFTKEQCLCRQKYWHRNLKADPNIYLRKSIFLLKGNATVWSNYGNNYLEKIEELRKNGGFVSIPCEGFS